MLKRRVSTSGRNTAESKCALEFLLFEERDDDDFAWGTKGRKNAKWYSTEEAGRETAE